MITTIVQFNLPQPLSREAAREVFSESAPAYQDKPGLIRKYYLFSEDGRRAGGVYLWLSRKAAEQQYDANWHAMIKARYGTEPTVLYFDTPVIVDNPARQIPVD
ncbi:MAG: YdhR family protein [Oceanospirillaceae bacterium]|nr:YdhR family protein [Oceanospirillaceae bacterium]